ncbi:hypothetical protein SpCBS45565_g03456 [Spizellomyces sp. 'palustris']|nr:hypothetical protein SpCBS45565_g03456 [Spizellomyces sp. 'palustris']
MPKEIVTLQLGHTANWVGTHFWNIQESYFHTHPEDEPEIQHDVLFRAGSNIHGEETYTPRLVLFDLKGTLKKVSPLYEPSNESASYTAHTWGGKVERYAEEPYPKNQFLHHLDEPPPEPTMPLTYADELERKVSVWSDFNKLYYHPKSIVEIPHYLHEDDRNPFSTFTQGLDVFSQPDVKEDVLDERLRFFVEECDSLQGFNLVADAVDGFSGIAASLLEYLRDEFPKKAAITFGIHKPLALEYTQKSRTICSINSALLLEAACRTSSLYIPLFPPTRNDRDPNGWSKYLSTDFASIYHWSAYLSTAIETTLLPVRVKANPIHMLDLADVVSGGSARTLAALASSLPFPMPKHAPFTTVMSPQNSRIRWMRDLTQQLPYDSIGDHFGHIAVLRGVAEIAKFQNHEHQQFPTTKSQVQEALDKLFNSPSTVGGRSIVLDQAMPVAETFPQFFTEHVDNNGVVDDLAKRSSGVVTRVATMTHLQISPQLKKLIIDAAQTLTRISTPITVLYEKGEHGISGEDWRAMREALEELAENYEE